MLGELRERVSQCIEHFEAEAPDEVTELKRDLDRYDRLRKAAGLNRRLLEQPSRLLPGVLGHIQGILEIVLGAIPTLIGLLLGLVPYLLARAYGKCIQKSGIQDLTRPQLLIVATIFVGYYALLISFVAKTYSDQATIAFIVILIVTSAFALTYFKRVRTIVAHIGDRTASWFKLGAVARVRQAQDQLVGRLDKMRNQYRQEVLGWAPLKKHSRPKATRAALIRVLLIALAVAGGLMFLEGYREKPIQGLRVGPSPWPTMVKANPEQARQHLLRDARGVLIAGQQLDEMQKRMAVLADDFQSGRRSFLEQNDQDEFRALLLAYVDLRAMLLKTIWMYRDNAPESPATTADDIRHTAFLTSYSAASLLTEKAWLIYDNYHDQPDIRRQLDLGDLAWGIPDHTYSHIVNSLTNRTAMAELQIATHRFERDLAANRFPQETPWIQLAERSKRSLPSVKKAFAGIGTRTLNRAVKEMQKQIENSADAVTPTVSVTVSRFRFKERPPHRGLVSPAQLDELRPILKPGDILIERRNWYISNCVLPGFWPHAALYLGSRDQLAALGVTEDPRVAPHMADFQGQDANGHDYAIIEAVGEGVIFTSLERSVGESDAVVILRPTLSDSDLGEALCRALSHRGKGYDFDFDFETPDRLVCTELVYRTYAPILDIPEMRTIAGKKRIAASDYVRMWADGQESDTPQLKLIRFYDFDEGQGIAVESDAKTLVETLERSRFTYMK